MTELTIGQLSERILSLEREVKVLRTRIDENQPKQGWRAVVGSMNDVPDETYAEFRRCCEEVRREFAPDDPEG